MHIAAKRGKLRLGRAEVACAGTTLSSGRTSALLARLPLRGLVSVGVKEGSCLSVRGREDGGLRQRSAG